MTRHRANARIGQRLKQARQRIALTLRISVNENNDAIARGRQTALQRAGFPMIFLSQQTNARFTRCDTLNFRSGVISRAVVHDDDFDFAFVVCGKQRAQSLHDDFFFVVRGHYDTDRLGKICFRSAPKLIREPNDNQRANDHQGRRHDHECPEKLFDAVVNAKSGTADQTGE